MEAMEWKPLGPVGLSSNLLSRDPETGARTALQRLNPDEGYQPPTIAHFHTTYEEILGVRGWFSFDQRTWVTCSIRRAPFTAFAVRCRRTAGSSRASVAISTST
jgi:hypothetical protein